MEFRDLKNQYGVLKEDIDKEISKVLESANFISGSQVKELEKLLGEYAGVENCITCANGTDAITLGLRAWNVGEGDGVFVPDFTFFSTAECPALEKCVPIFTDVDETTFNMCPESLEKAVKLVLEQGKVKPKVVIAVDLFGNPADYEAIKKIAKKYDLKVLEDGAQGFGGKIGDKRACSFGDISTTSFFPAKPLGCYGDGGAIFTDSVSDAELIRSLSVHGKDKNDKYNNIHIGYNSRLDTIQAAILKVKIEAFKNYEVEDVNKRADYYTENLCDIVKTPVIPKNHYSSWAQYTITLEDENIRDALKDFLKENGIPSMIYYPRTMSMQKALKKYEEYQVIECSNAKKLCKTVLSLPIHPYITKEEQDKVINCIKDFMNKR